MSETTATTNDQPQETVAELLQRLERTYVESARFVKDVKDQLLKVQDQLLAAQDAEIRSYQNFNSAKEQYLMNVINQQNARLQQNADADAGPVAVPALEPVAEKAVAAPESTESREDNVATE